MEENNAAVPGTWNPGTNYADTPYQLARIDKRTKGLESEGEQHDVGRVDRGGFPSPRGRDGKLNAGYRRSGGGCGGDCARN